jgi:hypothetical protein
MGLKDRLKKLEQRSKGSTIVIAQEGGPPAEFPVHAGMDAFTNFMERMGAGEDALPEHPLITAAKNSTDPKWKYSFFAVNDDLTTPIEDLSE